MTIMIIIMSRIIIINIMTIIVISSIAIGLIIKKDSIIGTTSDDDGKNRKEKYSGKNNFSKKLRIAIRLWK